MAGGGGRAPAFCRHSSLRPSTTHLGTGVVYAARFLPRWLDIVLVAQARLGF